MGALPLLNFQISEQVVGETILSILRIGKLHMQLHANVTLQVTEGVGNECLGLYLCQIAHQ